MTKKAAKKKKKMKTATLTAKKTKAASKMGAAKKKKSKGDVTIRGPKISDEHVRAKNGAPVSFAAVDASYDLVFDQPPPGDPNPWPFVEPADSWNPAHTVATISIVAGAPKRVFTMRDDVVHSPAGGYGYKVDLKPGGTRPIPEVVPDP